MLKNTFNILGVSLVDLSTQELITYLKKSIKEKRQTKLAFANAHTLNNAASSETYRRTLSSFLVVNDGVGVDIAKKVLHGSPFLENLNGTDFTPRLLSSLDTSHRVYLLGAKDSVIKKAKANLSKQHPKLNIVGFHNGYLSDNNRDLVVTEIRDLKTDILLVGMGNPLQEIWINQYANQTGASVLMGIGAFFDFASDEVSRAPTLFRKLRLEWVYRLILEPKRMFKRYVLGNPLFLLRVLKQRIFS